MYISDLADDKITLVGTQCQFYFVLSSFTFNKASKSCIPNNPSWLIDVKINNDLFLEGLFKICLQSFHKLTYPTISFIIFLAVGDKDVAFKSWDDTYHYKKRLSKEFCLVQVAGCLKKSVTRIQQQGTWSIYFIMQVKPCSDQSQVVIRFGNMLNMLLKNGWCQLPPNFTYFKIRPSLTTSKGGMIY